ncbi:MAG: hypothetical protein KC503_47635, partial [Myxococcales bacterium]|nr:hypothetical protein [Myxococcales bacterium]
PTARRAAPPTSPRRVTKPRADSVLRVTSRGGWRVVIDGASPAGAQGFALAVGLRGRLWRAELWGEASLPATLEDALTSVELARHGVGLAAGLRLWGGRRFELWAEGRAGVLAYLRSTVALDARVVASPSSTSAALLLGAGLRARLRPAPVKIPGFWLYAGLRADAVIGAPELVYAQGAGTLVERESLWPLQPTLAFGLALETP